MDDSDEELEEFKPKKTKTPTFTSEEQAIDVMLNSLTSLQGRTFDSDVEKMECVIENPEMSIYTWEPLASDNRDIRPPLYQRSPRPNHNSFGQSQPCIQPRGPVMPTPAGLFRQKNQATGRNFDPRMQVINYNRMPIPPNDKAIVPIFDPRMQVNNYNHMAPSTLTLVPANKTVNTASGPVAFHAEKMMARCPAKPTYAAVTSSPHPSVGFQIPAFGEPISQMMVRGPNSPPYAVDSSPRTQHPYQIPPFEEPSLLMISQSFPQHMNSGVTGSVRPMASKNDNGRLMIPAGLTTPSVAINFKSELHQAPPPAEIQMPPLPHQDLATLQENSPVREQLESIQIQGLQFNLPHKLYPCQIYMINEILKAIKQTKNALVSSPTGTGKTLALLASSITWLINEKSISAQIMAELDESKPSTSAGTSSANHCVQLSLKRSTATDVTVAGTSSENHFQPPLKRSSATDVIVVHKNNSRQKEDDWDEEDVGVFKSPKRKTTPVIPTPPLRGQERKNTEEHKNAKIKIYRGTPSGAAELFTYKKETTACTSEKSTRTPKIFYTSRTHHQISQVADELDQSGFGDRVRMAILSSRDIACVNPLVQDEKHSNDRCNMLIESHGCQYYCGSSKMVHNTHDQLAAKGLAPVFDIEDIISLGKRKKFCPYFTMKNMMKEADIILCPYNYIIDPQIRESMNIDITGNIIIMDEAHNVEDTCRELGSTVIRECELQMALLECEREKKQVDAYNTLEQILKSLLDWISISAESDYAKDNLPQNSFGDILSSHPGDGEEFKVRLEAINFNIDTISVIKDAMKIINEAHNNDPGRISSMPSLLKTLCSNIITVFGFVLDPNNGEMYRYYFTKELVEEGPKINRMGWMPKKNAESWNHSHIVWKFIMHVSCMKSSVIFHTLRDARTIIVASGTLTPIYTFETELDTKFHFKIRPDAVIKPQNLFVANVSSGKRTDWTGTYETAMLYDYQDDIGEAILQMAKIIPSGILVFFSSYKVMFNLRNRWATTNLLKKLIKIKTVFWETSHKHKFFHELQEYKDLIDISEKSSGRCKGGMFIGVFRGKLSEGTNFSDSYARAVIAVGVPYPNAYDPDINLKLKFNDAHSATMASGGSWLRAQAFRALNQALGRCIRHIDDYGAILLFDSRFKEVFHQNKLPKWVKQKLQEDRDYSLATVAVGLEAFYQNRK